MPKKSTYNYPITNIKYPIVIKILYNTQEKDRTNQS